jgi:hypothetical protein
LLLKPLGARKKLVLFFIFLFMYSTIGDEKKKKLGPNRVSAMKSFRIRIWDNHPRSATLPARRGEGLDM